MKFSKFNFKKKKNILEKYFNIFDKYPRHYFIFGIFFVAFLIIIKTIFTYTITDHDFYKEKADFQQILEVKIPITRWTIFSWNKKPTTLSTTVNLNDLAIDPTQPWDKRKLIWFLTDVIYKEICEKKTANECRDNILKFLKKTEIDNFIPEKTEIKKIIEKQLIYKISQKYITSLLITEELNKKQISDIESLKLPGLYIYEKWLYFDPTQISNKKLTAAKLSPIISFPEENLISYMKLRERKYISLLKKISIETSSEIQDFLKDEKNAIKKWYIKKEAAISTFIQLSPHPHRFYPENQTASQVLWFVDKEGKWHYWLEWYFDEILKWEAKEIVIRKDIKWRVINPIDLQKWFIEREWAVLYTTIDRNVQKKVEEILESWVKKYRANKWSVVIMNPKDGKIIAMANYPTFDPNEPWEVYELERVNYKKYKDPSNELIWKWVFVEDKIKWKEYVFNWKKILLRKATREELWNYALKKYKYKNDFWAWVYRNWVISDIYEPGSIMKAITMAIWIDSGEITRNTYYQNNWPIKIDQFPISDISKKCRGYHTFSHALNYSCNVWMVRIIQKVWKALLYNYLLDFGFWKPTEISLDWEVSLELKNYQKWSNAQLYTTSYWLGINVNQIQMAVAYSALANWWLILRPQIVDKIDFWDNNIITFWKEIIRRVISEETSKTMIDVLVDSVEKWVAKTWKVEWYLLAWKTWTSQIAYKWWYEDWNMPWATNASFAWFWPAQDPQFVIIVKLVRPRTNNYWGLTSAYIFADIAKYMLEYNKIPKIK